MAGSPWFDYATYMGNKLLQVQKSDPAGNWDTKKLVKAFAEAGFVGEVGAEAHFMQFGQFEDVAPNPFFNATEYYRAKAVEFTGKKPAEITDLDVANVELAIKGLDMGAWGHFKAFGSSEGVNPSNAFDTDAYIAAKVTALNAVLADGQTKYTPEDVIAAFKAMNISALEHFMTFGGDATKGEVPYTYNGTIPAEFAVPEDKKVKPENGEVTKNLTTAVDTVVVEGGIPTVVNGIYAGVGNTGTTINAGDTITGGSGKDTFRITTTTSGVIPAVQTTGVEVYELTSQIGSNTATLAFHAGSTGVETLRLTNGVNQNVKITNANANLKFEMVNDASKVALLSASSYNGSVPETVSLLANGVKNGEFSVANGTTTLEVTVTGADSKFNALADEGTDLTTINVLGTKKLAVTTAIEAEVTLVDASKQTAGGVDISLSGAATKFLGGAGDDVVKLINAGAQSAEIKGGDGNDTIVFDSTSDASYADSASKISGFEVLRLESTAGTFAFDAISGLKKLELGTAALTGDLNVTGLAGDTIVSVIGNVSGNFDTVLSAKVNGSDDKLDLRFETAGKTGVKLGGTAGSGLKIAGYENLQVTSNGSLKATDQNTLNLDGAQTALKNVLIDGDSNFTLVNLNANINVNAAEFDHKLDLSFVKATAKTTIIGGTADDIFRTTAIDSNLHLNGGTGTDKLELTLGADTTLTGASLQNIKSIEKFDIVQSSHAFVMEDGGNFASVFADGIDITLTGATTNKATTISALPSYTGNMKVDITNTGALTTGSAITVTTGGGNDIINVKATAAGTATIAVNGGAGDDSISLSFKAATISASSSISVTGGAGKDTMIVKDIDAIDNQYVKFVIAAGDSTFEQFDVINSFARASGVTAQTQGMTLDFDSASVFASKDFAGFSTSANGLVTFKGTNADLSVLEKAKLIDASMTTDGQTAAFVVGTDVYIVNNDADGDSLVQLTGIGTSFAGVSTGTSVADTVLIA